MVVVSVKAAEKGLSTGHAWIRLQEPFENEGKQYVRIFSVGWFLRGKLVSPDLFEFTPRRRIEVAFETSEQQFKNNLEMMKLFRIYSQNKTSVSGETADKFNQWLKGDCVEFVVERIVDTYPEAAQQTKNSRSDAVQCMFKEKMDKILNPEKKTKTYKGVSWLNRLKLPYRANKFGNPATIRKWQRELVNNNNEAHQVTAERPLNKFSII